MDHFSSLDARSSYMCYKCNFSSKSACYLKQHLLNLKLSHLIHFHFFLTINKQSERLTKISIDKNINKIRKEKWKSSKHV